MPKCAKGFQLLNLCATAYSILLFLQLTSAATKYSLVQNLLVNIHLLHENLLQFLHVTELSAFKYTDKISSKDEVKSPINKLSSFSKKPGHK